MKSLVLVLAALLIAKLAINAWNYRVAAEEALVAAYGARAVEACQNDARTRGFPPLQARTRPGEVRLVVGSSNADVWFWDVANAAWTRRFRTPYLKLEMQAGQATLQCSFDITQKTAVVTR